MPLDEIRLPPLAWRADEALERIVVAGERRIVAINAADRNSRLPAFVPADYRALLPALLQVYQNNLAPNRRFCEWGSGLGVVAMLAQRIGFDACGIEIEPELVEEARRLAQSQGLQTAFVRGTFIPEAVEHLADTHDDLATLARGCADGYDALDLEPADFGLIYAYPWPGEEAVVESIFQAVAATGTLLLTYRSTEDVVLQRKV